MHIQIYHRARDDIRRVARGLWGYNFDYLSTWLRRLDVKGSEDLEDKAVLMYCKDGVIYPVALTEEQDKLFQLTISIFSPLKIIRDRPQGKAINLLEKKNAH